MNARGFFGIGVWHPKTGVNVGTLWRHAGLYGASYIFTVGRRYRHQPSDTRRTPGVIPLFHFDTLEAFEAGLPNATQIVCVEVTERAKPLRLCHHPERAAYLLGAEDDGLPEQVMAGRQTIMIETPMAQSLNVACAGTLVMNDRYTKALQMRQPRRPVA